MIRAVDLESCESRVVGQIQHAMDRQGEGSLEALLRSEDTWTVETSGQAS